MKCSLGISNFLEEISSLPFCCFPLFLCIDHWGRLSFLSLLFFGALYSHENIFPFLLCFWLLFFSQLFVRPPQTATLLFCISFPWGWSWSILDHPMNSMKRQNDSILKGALPRSVGAQCAWNDGIPVELFQILKDDAVKVLLSICQQIWKTQQWPQDRKRSVFIPIPK